MQIPMVCLFFFFFFSSFLQIMQLQQRLGELQLTTRQLIWEADYHDGSNSQFSLLGSSILCSHHALLS